MDLITAHGREAIAHATGRQEKMAVALAYIGTDYGRIDHLSNLKTFTPKEKYQMLQTLQQSNATALHGFSRSVLDGIEANDRFNLIKESLQFPYLDAACEGFSSRLFLSVFDHVANQRRVLGDDVALMHQLIGNVRRDLADVMNSTVDEISRKFRSCYVNDMTYEWLADDYFDRANHVFYLIAACCYSSDADDINISLSYLTEALELPKESDSKWVARDLLFHLQNLDAVNDYARYYYNQ